jgi:integrase
MPNRKSLTDANVSALESRPKKYDVFDSGSRGVPGFCVRVEASGKKTFYLRYSLCGGLYWFRIGPAALGASEARIEARKLIGDIARGINPHRDRMAQRTSGTTFEQLCRRYLEEHAKRFNKSWKQDDYLMRAYMLPKWAKLKAASITRADVRQLIGSIKAPQVANQVKAKLSGIFRFAVEQEIMATNHCRDIKNPHPTKDRERIMSPAEIAQFWKACNSIHPIKAAALKVVLLTGQRPGEVSHMRMEHVRDGWWEQPKDPQPELKWPGTKNGRTQFVWLTDEVRRLISVIEQNGVAFPNAWGNPTRDLDDAMRELSELYNFDPPVKPHDLRRTFGSTVTRLEFGRDAMDRLLNHYKKSDTNTYDRNPYAEKNKLIWERVGAEIMRIAEGREENNVVAANFGSRGA